MQKTVLLLIFLFTGIVLQAQEFLAAPAFNPALYSASSQDRSLWRSGSGERDTLCLPFFDDFSNPRRWLGAQGSPCLDSVYPQGPDVYPNTLFWCSEGAYINSTYPDNPPSYGVATLDGLNRYGKPYNESAPYGPADTLLSRPIRLGGPLADSVFLSFFYQPGGLGDSPEAQDSLILQFRREDSVWVTVWTATNTNGTIPDPFRLAMINAGAPEFRYDGFQFRFRNYATRSGNNDHWHLDYILLDEDRNRSDTLFRDVSFAAPPASMLRRYHSMPWRQFREDQPAQMRSGMSARVYNLFNTAINTNFQDSLLEESSGTLIGLTASESAAVPARGFYTYGHDNHEILSGVPGFSGDSLNLLWRLRLRPSGDIDPFNDTLLIRQPFYNYYAYDDGSAEKSYGLIGTGAKLAYRFETNQPDSVYAVYIHWAFVNGGLGDKFFSLIVYHSVDTSGATDADSILYQEDFLVPKYPDSVNGWWVYNLEQPVPVNGIFYIGWLQSQEDILSVGFDVNTLANDQVFFNLGDSWLPSTLPGALMMRPQTGPNYRVYPTLGIPGAELPGPPIRFGPNPAKDFLYWQVPDLVLTTGWRYTLSDLSGRIWQQGDFHEQAISLKHLPAGLFFLSVRTGDAGMQVFRFVHTP